jgi:hypothetical protein
MTNPVVKLFERLTEFEAEEAALNFLLHQPSLLSPAYTEAFRDWIKGLDKRRQAAAIHSMSLIETTAREIKFGSRMTQSPRLELACAIWH